ncbi:hypothetical protein VUR80DRAFT_2939 [Thermomyces stellatus]
MAHSPSLTANLLSSSPAAFQRATQSPFLKSAAAGDLRKDTLGTWLANDRLYILSYIKGAGKLLSFLELPQEALRPGAPPPPSSRLFGWLVDAYVNVRREERFFVDTAARYGIEINLPAGADGRVEDGDKLEGLRRFERLFEGVQPHGGSIPWLEAAVLFYATEKAYLEAWTWAKSQLVEQDASKDADGGSLRNDFIPNWTSKEFGDFVDQLGDIIDAAVAEQVKIEGDHAMQGLYDRASKVWDDVIAAEEAFWPKVE